MPGCGKSVLASTIIEHIMVLCEKDSIRRNILYFYFDFRQDIKQTRDGFLRSMLVQLSCTFTVFPEELEKLYLQHESKKQQPTISSFIETFISLLKRSKPSYLVIDALDECSMRGSQERQGMLNLIRRLKTDGFEHLNLMILSRKEQDIENGLINVFTNNVHIQNKTVDADIRVHVRRLLADDARLNKKSPAVKAEIEKRLVFGAGGM